MALNFPSQGRDLDTQGHEVHRAPDKRNSKKKKFSKIRYSETVNHQKQRLLKKKKKTYKKKKSKDF